MTYASRSEAHRAGSLAAMDRENERLRREVQELRVERDGLWKTLVAVRIRRDFWIREAHYHSNTPIGELPELDVEKDELCV